MILEHSLKEDSKSVPVSIRVTSTIWFVLFLSVVVGIAVRLEAKLFFSTQNSRNFFSNSFHFARLMISTDPSDIELHVYTRKNPKTSQRLLANDTINRKTNFDPKKETKILIHGFSAGIYFAHRFVSEYLHAGDYNIVAIDWSMLSSWDNYPVAAQNAVIVGGYVGKFLAKLVRDTGLDPSKIHIIGHSLGSHVAAHIGREIQRAGLGKIARITALDPARPWFDGENTPFRISKEDATFVDVIHTNSGLMSDGCYSWSEPLGHVDYYPNGGVHQPGCAELCVYGTCSHLSFMDLAGCSHDRSISYFISSINSGRRFKSKMCSSWSKFTSGKCSDGPEAIMGEQSDLKLPEGKYFLEVLDHHHHPHPTQHSTKPLVLEVSS